MPCLLSIACGRAAFLLPFFYSLNLARALWRIQRVFACMRQQSCQPRLLGAAAAPE